MGLIRVAILRHYGSHSNVGVSEKQQGYLGSNPNPDKRVTPGLFHEYIHLELLFLWWSIYISGLGMLSALLWTAESGAEAERAEWGQQKIKEGKGWDRKGEQRVQERGRECEGGGEGPGKRARVKNREGREKGKDEREAWMAYFTLETANAIYK